MNNNIEQPVVVEKIGLGAKFLKYFLLFNGVLHIIFEVYFLIFLTDLRYHYIFYTLFGLINLILSFFVLKIYKINSPVLRSVVIIAIWLLAIITLYYTIIPLLSNFIIHFFYPKPEPCCS